MRGCDGLETFAMTVTLRRALLHVPLFCLLVSFSAHAAQPQPGQWRVTTKTTIAGLPAGVPAGMQFWLSRLSGRCQFLPGSFACSGVTH